MRQTSNEHLICMFHPDIYMYYLAAVKGGFSFLAIYKIVWHSGYLRRRLLPTCHFNNSNYFISAPAFCSLASTLSCSISFLILQILSPNTWLQNALWAETFLDTHGVKCVINSLSVFVFLCLCIHSNYVSIFTSSTVNLSHHRNDICTCFQNMCMNI